jgi:hypothetical protein
MRALHETPASKPDTSSRQTHQPDMAPPPDAARSSDSRQAHARPLRKFTAEAVNVELTSLSRSADRGRRRPARRRLAKELPGVPPEHRRLQWTCSRQRPVDSLSASAQARRRVRSYPRHGQAGWLAAIRSRNRLPIVLRTDNALARTNIPRPARRGMPRPRMAAGYAGRARICLRSRTPQRQVRTKRERMGVGDEPSSRASRSNETKQR